MKFMCDDIIQEQVEREAKTLAQTMPHPCNISITEEAARRLFRHGHNPLAISQHYWDRCQEEKRVEFYVGEGEMVLIHYDIIHHKISFYTSNR